MSDLIRRKDAIEAIEEMQMPIMRSEFSGEQFVFTGMAQALQAIKGLPSAQPHWIPCSERLPKHNQKILAYYADIDRIMLISFNSHGITTMTAWMPIPTYGGESDDAD